MRLSLIRDRDWDEAARLRLHADAKYHNNQQQQLNNSNTNLSSSNANLEGISAKTEWFDTIPHAWAVESVPMSGSRFEEAASTSSTSLAAAAGSSSSRPPLGAAGSASAATTPFRSGPTSSGGGSTTVSYVALCLGTSFTQELCQSNSNNNNNNGNNQKNSSSFAANGSLPVQVLRRMRAAGSNPLGVLCNVAVVMTQSQTGAVTMKDLTEQLLPEEILADAARFHDHHQSDNESGVLESSDAACTALQLPSFEFQFVRCGAEGYGRSHSSHTPHHHHHHHQQQQQTPTSTATSGRTTPFVKGDSQLSRLSMNQHQPDAALVETLVESLADSDTFQAAIHRASVVFSFFDEHTRATSQVWFLSDAQLPFFGNTELLTPGVWRAAEIGHAGGGGGGTSSSSSASTIMRSLTLDTVVFAHSSLLAQGEQFDRVVHAAANEINNASSFLSSHHQNNDPLLQGGDRSRSGSADLNSRRSQLLQQRSKHEQALADLQQRIASAGNPSEKLAAERQYQRLLMGEMELLERRIEEVKQLTAQERQVTEEIEAKKKTALAKVATLEEQKKTLVSEMKSLGEEVRSNSSVSDALQAQIQLLEQRLAVASSSIVTYRSASEGKQRIASNDLKNEQLREIAAKHELALAEAQRHFSQVQQQVADENRESEEQFNSDMRLLQSEISEFQQQVNNDGSKLGEMKANLTASQSLQHNLEKEYHALRDAMNKLLEDAPELAAAQPGSVLDERRDKLVKTVAEHKQQLSDLKIKLDDTRLRREAIEDRALTSERMLQRHMSTVALKIPPQLDLQREHLCDEEEHLRKAIEHHAEAASFEQQAKFYLAMFDRSHVQNCRRHARRHDELRLEVSVCEEALAEATDKLNQVRASCDVFTRRMDECSNEQQRLRDGHQKSITEMQRQLIQAESEPVEEAVKKESEELQRKIRQRNAEIELVQGALMKAPGMSSSAGSVVAAAALNGTSTTFASHRTLRAAAPVASEIRHRLKLLRRDSYHRNKVHNAKAAELDQRLEQRRRELTEKAGLISTIRTTVTELHEGLQLRTTQLEERKQELDMLKHRDEVLIADLQEELEYARDISNRHKNENRLQLSRVAQLVQEQEAELARSRHEVAKLERTRNDVVRRMSDSNEATLLMELEHEQERRRELREQLAQAGVAASPEGGGGAGSRLSSLGAETAEEEGHQQHEEGDYHYYHHSRNNNRRSESGGVDDSVARGGMSSAMSSRTPSPVVLMAPTPPRK